MKKAEMEWWIIGLIIAIVALLLFLWLYLNWQQKTTAGTSLIKDLMRF